MANTTSRAQVRTAPAESAWAGTGRKYVVEAIGTFFLVFTVVISARSGSTFTPLAAGAVLMVMVYAGGHISGGHYNPAVTLAVLVRRRISLTDAIAYWIVQLVAGGLGSLLACAILDQAEPKTISPSGHALLSVLLVELLFTFALCYVVLNVATSKNQSNNSFFGLAIGFTVAAGAFAVGGISGGLFNPAVTLGAAIAELVSWQSLWIYLLVQVVAGVIAGLAFRALNPDDK